LKNIIETRQGSRRMLPEFASDIYNILFEPVDEISARMLGDRMIEAIKYWDDRVIINRLDIKPEADKNQYTCRLNFKVKSSPESSETISFIISA
jgi:phage baseplate assembly protein W